MPPRPENFSHQPRRVAQENGRVQTPGLDVYLSGALQGNPLATEQLFSTIHPTILRFCNRRWIRTYAPIDVEDIAQQTMLEIYRGLSRFENREAGSFMTYVFQLADSRIKDSWRTLNRDKSIPIDVFSQDEEPSTNDHYGFERGIRQLLTNGIAGLSANEQDVITLNVLAGYDISEIAEMLGKTSGSVRTLKSRGLSKLKTTLTSKQLEMFL